MLKDLRVPRRYPHLARSLLDGAAAKKAQLENGARAVWQQSKDPSSAAGLVDRGQVVPRADGVHLDVGLRCPVMPAPVVGQHAADRRVDVGGDLHDWRRQAEIRQTLDEHFRGQVLGIRPVPNTREYEAV